MAGSARRFPAGRYLGIFVLIVIGLYALVFFTGDGKATPKLGIDLQGGTRITLNPVSPDGKPPQQNSLDLAKQILTERVNGNGVVGAEIVQDGTNLVITAPGAGGDRLKSIGEPAVLRFRSVLTDPASGQPLILQASPSATSPTTTPTPSGQSSSGSSKPTVTTSNSTKSGSAASNSSAPATSSTPAGVKPQAAVATTPSSAPPTSSSASSDQGAPDAKTIAALQAIRQNPAVATDVNAQIQAINATDCSKPDPLSGYDDPTRPLVTCDQNHQVKYILGPSFLDGDQIQSATSGLDTQKGGYVVNLNFKPKGSDIWAAYTQKNVGQHAAFVLDTQVVSAPSITTAIVGTTEIEGSFTAQQASQLANVLNFGSLPLTFKTSESETVSASLGLTSLQSGLIAGGIGLLLVIVYCLFYYRALGLLTLLSLVCSGTMIYAVLVLLGRWMGYSLNLAGVAGFIIAIGITADSFVVFFERLKDEIREGRTFRSAVPRAWVRARRTILVADTVYFLAAAVLYALAIGDVRGFAFTLGMSTVLDLVIVFLVTHPLVMLASWSKTFSKPSFSGLGAVQRAGAALRAAASSPATSSPATKEA